MVDPDILSSADMQVEHDDAPRVRIHHKGTPLGEDIAYGLEHTLFCLSTDAFTDPLIADKIQQKFGGVHKGNLKENFIAEIGGDFSGFALFVALRSLGRPWFESAKHAVRSWFEPFYEKLGRKELHLDSNAALSQHDSQKLETWKNFQADTFVKSNTLSLLSTITNTAILKGIGSPYKVPLLFASKFAATLVTTTAMVSARMALPHTMQSLDSELSARYFDPMIRGTQNMLKLSSSYQPTTSSNTSPQKSAWQNRVSLHVTKTDERTR